MTMVRTMCPMNCHPTLCGMEVQVASDHSVTITGNEDNPDSQGFLCMRGKAAHEIVGNPGRLLTPRLRTPDGGWTDSSWDDALDLIADHMRRVGPQGVGMWQGHGNAVNDYGTGVKRGQMDRFANLYGCQYWNPAMICWGLGGLGIGLTGALETTAKEEIGTTSDLIVLWGANTVSQAHTLRHVEIARRRGAHVIAIDVRRTEASALSNEVLLVRPGSDADLALAVMHVIFAEGLEDQMFLETHTVGADELRAHVTDFTPEWAAARTGIPADAIIDLARRLASAKAPVIILGGSSIHKGRNSWQAARAISCLPALVGAYGTPGGGLGPRHGARSGGGGFTDISAADRRVPGTYVPNQMERIVESIEDGTVRVLFALGSNMVSSFPDANRFEAALGKLDLLVAYDIFDNPMIRDHADVVLPGTIWLEELGIKATNGFVHLCDQALPAAGGTRPLYTLYQELAARLDIADVYPWPDQEAAINAVLDHPSTGHVTVAELRAEGGSRALNVTSTGHAARRFATPSGKVELFSTRAVEHDLPPLPMPSQPARPEANTYPLSFAHGRTFAHFHGFYDQSRALPTLAAREAAPAIWIAPDDAKARNVADGDAVELFNDRGIFAGQAKVTPRIPPGTVWCRDGWPSLNAITQLRSDVPDAALALFPFSVGQSQFGAEVDLRPRPAQS